MGRLKELCTRVFRSKDLRQEKGWFLVSAIIMITFLTAVALALAGLTAVQFQDTVQQGFAQNANLVAEAGIEQSVDQLNAGSSGVFTNQQLPSNSSTRGCGTFTTTVTGSSTSKTIVSTGNAYRSASCATTPMATRKVRVTVTGTTSSGYSVYVGPGGLSVSASSDITNTSVYVGGKLTLGVGAQIGTNSHPVTLNVGDIACPTGANPGPTFPTLCPGQPITAGISATVYGTVCATNQTTSSFVQPNSGFQANCTAPAASPPTYDRLAQINAVTTTGSGSGAQYQCNPNSTITWPANLKLTGNVSAGGSCNLIVSGNVWITGNLLFGPSQITVAPGVATPPVIMVDGTISVGGSASITANGNGVGIQFISFKSTNPCTVATTVGTYCTSISGNDLYNSQQATTVSVSTANLPNMSFDAYWGAGSLSGSGTVGSFSGQAISIGGSGAIVFGSTQSSSGSSTWTISSYQPIFN